MESLVYQSADFRMHEPIECKGPGGQTVRMQLCEELDPESGRWEPYYAMVAIEQES